MIQLKFSALNQFASLPVRKHDGDAGMDVTACEKVEIKPFGRATIRTGLVCEIPKGYELQVRPRSGLAAKGIVAMFGTVDSGYRGEIGVTLANLTEEPYIINIGDRIAQLILAPVSACRPIWGVVNEYTERGKGNFGSTGK